MLTDGRALLPSEDLPELSTQLLLLTDLPIRSAMLTITAATETYMTRVAPGREESLLARLRELRPHAACIGPCDLDADMLTSLSE
jgi:hypothetical protein